MDRDETESARLDRQRRAIAGLLLDRAADEEAQRTVVEEAARRAIQDNWPAMPEDERRRLVESVVGFEAISYQLAIFRRGWATGKDTERIQLDPETAGPRILVRAYATAEADALRMRREAEGRSSGDAHSPSLEDRLRRYLPPVE